MENKDFINQDLLKRVFQSISILDGCLYVIQPTSVLESKMLEIWLLIKYLITPTSCKFLNFFLALYSFVLTGVLA